MNIDDIYKLFLNIKNEGCTEISSTLNLKHKMLSYINNNESIKSSVTASISENNFTINFTLFNLKLECNESIKLYDFPPIVASCMELHFFFRENETIHSVLKIYITSDGYIMKNVFVTQDICKTNNEHRGKKVFDEILSSLIDKGYVVLKPDQIA
ncbi:MULTISPECIES: hypothetical protein [Klebsiella]|uniref:hypothetical protein n=1 Tax=Klebsiella TaxID=570 RepID=UPI002994AB95|nr:hypothetical protein [Klebsiella pneumoniae]HBQ5410086.1 hypothetical protein [Klebsiella pneumoniae]HBQ5610544.1 hypothetical protein [Klebsiella pneumoniae]HBQ5618554.1 hypothetical protein [Klebsiella pneumoniae]HBW3319767.1 hypothetical protein [Klebsiella pneumoniae]